MDVSGGRQRLVWGMAILVGLAGQGLFAHTNLGLNGAILSLLVFGAAVVVARGLPNKPDRKIWLWGIPIVGGAIGLLLVDSTFLQTLNVAMVLAGCGMMALGAHRKMGEGALMSGLMALFGWALLASEGIVVFCTTKFRNEPMSAEAKEKVKAVGRGVMIAAPLLGVFGLLLVSADPVFTRMITPHIELNMTDLWVRGILFGAFAVFASGMLNAMVGRSQLPIVGPPKETPAILGTTEYGIVFGSLSVLFAVFLAVQARYLFGGSDVVLATEGLTYAQYARRGFF